MSDEQWTRVRVVYEALLGALPGSNVEHEWGHAHRDENGTLIYIADVRGGTVIDQRLDLPFGAHASGEDR
jgi:hypothetical protein